MDEANKYVRSDPLQSVIDKNCHAQDQNEHGYLWVLEPASYCEVILHDSLPDVILLFAAQHLFYRYAEPQYWKYPSGNLAGNLGSQKLDGHHGYLHKTITAARWERRIKMRDIPYVFAHILLAVHNKNE